jgi:hypothetical protein
MSRSQTVIIIMCAFFALITFQALNNKVISSNSGASAARTGSPGDGGLTCTSCHSGPAAATQTGWITSNIPLGGYVPGSTYTITATATRPGHVRFGFEISPQTISGSLQGTLVLTNTIETKLVGSSKYITHTSSGTSGPGGSRSWNFNWIAPAAGTGDVTFYGAFNVTNNSGTSSGDTTYKSTLIVTECAAPAQPQAITGYTSVCSGSVQNYSVPNDPGATSYIWTLPAGWTGASTTSTIAATAGNTSGTISVRAVNSCGNSVDQNISVQVIQLNANTSSTNISCNGFANGSANANPSGGNAPYSYSWNTFPVQTSQSVSGLSSGSYTVTVTDNNGCSQSASVNINEPSILSTTINTTGPLCANSNDGTASAATTGGTLPYTYLWNTNPVQVNPTAVNLSPGVYNVTVTDANNCSVTQSITIASAPAIILNLNQTDVSCNGGNDGNATVNASGGVGNFTYSWNTNPVQTTVTAGQLTAGNYTITVTDANGCTAISSVIINEPAAIPAFVITQQTDTLYSTAAVAYQWLENGIPLTGENNIFFIPDHDGNYSVTITDNNGCTTTSLPFAFILDGINKPGVFSSLKLYPSPASDHLILISANKNIEKVYITDSFGKTITSMLLKMGSTEIDVSTLLPGVYFLSAGRGNITQTLRFTVAR